MGSSNPTRMDSEGLSHAHTTSCNAGNKDVQLWLVGAGMRSTLASSSSCPLMSSVLNRATFITASTASSHMQKGFSCTTVDSWEWGGCTLTQPVGLASEGLTRQPHTHTAVSITQAC